MINPTAMARIWVLIDDRIIPGQPPCLALSYHRYLLSPETGSWPWQAGNEKAAAGLPSDGFWKGAIHGDHDVGCLARIPEGLHSRESRNNAYFSDELIDANLPFRVVPRPFTAAMMARAIPAAISPYSIAVAPLSFFKNREISCIKSSSLKRSV